MARSSENSYKSIIKGTSLFGSVQLIQILVNLVRGKFVAIFLGPAGMGINALFNTAMFTITQFSSLGLRLALVREVAVKRDDPSGLGQLIGIGKMMIWATALAGGLLTILFSGVLSRFTFGTEAYTLPFVLLGLAVFLNVAGNGMMAMLQGMHDIKRLSKASLVGPVAGLIFAVPLYWAFGDRAIVPAIVILNFAILVFYWISLRGSLRETQYVRRFRFVWQEHGGVVKRLLLMGFVLMASDLIGSGLGYGLNVVLRLLGGVADVGLYQSANSLTNQYCGVVFAAMAMDYFPRLTAVAKSNHRIAVLANRQLEIVIVIVAPIVALLILSAPLVIRLLLTDKFLPVTELMRWMGLGVLLKAIHYPLGYITFAKDNKRVFFWLEGVVGNLVHYGLAAVGFWIWGLIGMGYAMVADSLVTIVIYLWVNRRLYGTVIRNTVWKRLIQGVLLTTSVFLFSFMTSSFSPLGGMSGYVGMGIMTLFTVAWAIRLLMPMLKR